MSNSVPNESAAVNAGLLSSPVTGHLASVGSSESPKITQSTPTVIVALSTTKVGASIFSDPDSAKCAKLVDVARDIIDSGGLGSVTAGPAAPNSNIAPPKIDSTNIDR